MQPRVNQTVTGHFQCPVLPLSRPIALFIGDQDFGVVFESFLSDFLLRYLPIFLSNPASPHQKCQAEIPAKQKKYAESAFFLRK